MIAFCHYLEKAREIICYDWSESADYLLVGLSNRPPYTQRQLFGFDQAFFARFVSASMQVGEQIGNLVAASCKTGHQQ